MQPLGYAASVTFTNLFLSVIILVAASTSTILKVHLCLCEFVCMRLCEIQSLDVSRQVTATGLNPIDLCACVCVCNGSYSHWPRWTSQLAEKMNRADLEFM